MKRLAQSLLVLSIILSSGAAAQQVTITLFGGSQTENFSPNYLLGATQTTRTYNFANPTAISAINITYQSTGDCYEYQEDTDGDGTPETTRTECGNPQLCITTPTLTEQCKPLVMQGTFVRGGQQKLIYILPQAIITTSITFTYKTHQNRGDPPIKIIKLDWDGGLTYSITKPLNTFQNKTGPITLGRIANLLATQGYFGEFKITSSNSKVFPYFAPDQSYTPENELQKTTTPSDLALACLNSDNAINALGEPLCDYQKEEECANQNSDWYNGACCGDAPVNPEAESTPSQCKYYGAVSLPGGSRAMNAICGKSGTNWVWAGQLDPGVITDFTSCGAMTQVVATGTGFLTCGNTQNNAGITVAALQGTTNIAGHTYWCQTGQLLECGGNNPYSDQNYALTTGANTIINNEQYYCKSSGALSLSLDGDQDACIAAGFSWTGTKCCGEPNDLLATYTDPSGQGVCSNNQVITQGTVLGTEQNILIHNGAYYFCNEQKIAGTTGTTILPDYPGATITEYGPCGTPLTNVFSSGTDKNAICEPNGKWHYVNYTQNSLIKQTAWAPEIYQESTGCCPTSMCWDGNKCRSTGEFISIQNQGYKCQ